MDDELVVKGARGKAALLVLLALALAATAYHFTPRGGALTAVGVGGIVFAALCGGYALFRFVRPGVAVLIDRAGIVDGASALAVGRMAWDEIGRAEVYEFMGQTMLGITPRDLEAFLRRQPLWRRLLLRANMALGCPPVNIPEAMLPISAGEVLAAMERIGGTRWRAGDQERVSNHGLRR
jgi:hypothetical protein